MSEVRVMIAGLIAFALGAAICILLVYGLGNWRRACREMWLVYIGVNVTWLASLLWARELMQ